MTANPVFIIQVGTQCASSLKSNFGALSRQTFKEWSLVFIDDASTDETSKEANRLINMYGLEKQVQVQTDSESKGMVEHVWTCLDRLKKSENPPESVVLLSGHHRFSHDRALEKIVSVLRNDWHMVWGKWRDQENQVNSQGAYHP